MEFSESEKATEIRSRVLAFLAEHVWPLERARRVAGESDSAGLALTRFQGLARAAGLWNLCIPDLADGETGTGLSNLDYAPSAELIGRCHWSAEIFNCGPPDASIIALLRQAGTPRQRSEWLAPMMSGEMRAAFAMSEPGVASSDAANIAMHARATADGYVLNGRKSFVTNMRDPRTGFLVVAAVTEADDAAKRHSLLIVPRHATGVRVVRDVPLMHRDWPGGCCDIAFEEVRVPAPALLGRRGQGLELCQALLAPARLHHCMRSLGQCEQSIELMAERACGRRAFGRLLAEHGTTAERIARARLAVDQARLLTLRAAWRLDRGDARTARLDIAMAKAVVPGVQQQVADTAIQIFGAEGLSQDWPLADGWNRARTLRIADGPDEVHLQTVARAELSAARSRLSASAREPAA